MRRKLAMTAALVVALAAAGYAQKPDFSGTWTPDVDPAAAAAPAGGGGGGRGGGGAMNVKQTATQLLVEDPGRNGPPTPTHKLGRAGARMGKGQITAQGPAKRDGSKLRL